MAAPGAVGAAAVAEPAAPCIRASSIFESGFPPGADGAPETFPVAVLDGCKGRPLPEILSIVQLGVEIGEVVTADGKPLGPGSEIHLTVNGIDRRRRDAERSPSEPPPP